MWLKTDIGTDPVTTVTIHFPLSRFIVKDRSMEPAYCEGDHILASTFGKLRRGSAVIFKKENKYLIKRIKSLTENSVILEADNKMLAKKVWEIKRDEIVGKVILKY